MKNIKVLGIGNILVGDDGFGPRVLEELQTREIPENVELIDAGVGGMAILSWIEDADKIIIIDSVQTGNEPVGTIYRFTDKEMPPSDMFMLSLHDLNLVDTINIGRVVQKMPDEIIIYGVEVVRLAEFTKEMSPEVEAAVKEVADLVIEEIKNS
ncbi:hydrogenase maturation protease [Methanocella arvoryzae]|uniref:Coenzyme F420-nonreducing hydrogenase,subunit D (Maturation factor) n=1 Tax=Methanocella arvoryzae (strain DSM 22066 / NBRC 105507 / MRE50) TaxID=351160 RepID=Q0W3K7_METAR|nr:hydrogenase maturation protease [Methanocella arvoryzae]CAJ37036.1 putative coenzyme F420-nonreducing hydrogenase,subunit D (maturation factor) [Methanocella arvoryzae MRE50]